MKRLLTDKKFLDFLDILPYPIIVFNTGMRVTHANKRGCVEFNNEKKNLAGLTCRELFFSTSASCPRGVCPIDTLKSKKIPVNNMDFPIDPTDLYLYNSIGVRSYSELCFSPVMDDNGKVEYIIASMEDVSRARVAEKELKRAAEFLKKIIDSSILSIIVADMNGVILLMSESAGKIFGYTDAVAIGKSIAEYLYVPGGARSIMKKLRSDRYGGVGKLDSLKISALNASGEEIPVEMTASILYEDGREIASMAIYRDLRQEIEAEKKIESARMQLVQSEKLASVGRLSAGVAHELNNPLSGIIMYCLLSMETLEKGHPVHPNLKKIDEQASRCKKIVKGLLDFSRQHEPDLKAVNINMLIDEALSLIENQASFNTVEIKKKYESGLPIIMGDKSQLQQVFINLALNAAQAMDGKGVLTLLTSTRKKHLIIEFEDTGPGISTEDLKKIFEPFYTKGARLEGTGLGLSVSHGIITKHEGSITASNRMNRGAVITITLPVK